MPTAASGTTRGARFSLPNSVVPLLRVSRLQQTILFRLLAVTGDPVVLMSSRADRDRTALLELAAQLVAVSTSAEGALATRMSERFPWMLALNVAEQESCAKDVLAAARASFATSQPHLTIAELTSWRETASAIAADLGNASVEWLDGPVHVRRP